MRGRPSSGEFFDIRLGLCPTESTALSAALDSNYGHYTPVEVVHSHSREVSGPPRSWLDWPLDEPFAYTEGNLLFEIRWDSGTGFQPMIRGPGDYTARAYVWDDTSSSAASRDAMRNRLRITFHDPVDVELSAIPCAGIALPSGAPVALQAVWRSRGELPADFIAWLALADPRDSVVFRDSLQVTGLAAGQDTALDLGLFACNATGTWSMRCSTRCTADMNTLNDTATARFEVHRSWSTGWAEMTPMPPGPTPAPVGQGGWLVYVTGESDAFGGQVYAAKGNKTDELYRYHVYGDSWKGITGMPYTSHSLWYKKPPRKGSVGCSDGEDFIYVTQGNNTLGFYRLAMDGDSWETLTDVPEGTYRKKVKGGTDMAYVVVDDTGYVYLLKGYKTEFYRYNTALGTWETLTEAPIGERPKWDKGSWLLAESQEAEYLWAHKAKYHELYQYFIDGDSWGPEMPGMPFIGHSGRRKKSKDGGSAAFYDGAIYALKGGNTQEWWRYTVEDSVWTELETMPSYGSSGRKKRVKYGGDVASYGNGAFFALKGNKTLEFWRYICPTLYAAGVTRDAGRGILSGVGRQASGALVRLSPNPLTGRFVTAQYGLPQAGPFSVRVFDIAGRELLCTTLAAGHPASSVLLDCRTLAAGVYLVRLDCPGRTAAAKLVVNR